MIQFKTPRIEEEFSTLDLKNPGLVRLVALASEYAEIEFKKPLVLTCIYRSPAENAELYKESVEPAWKPHTLWSAVDLRSSIYSEAEIQKLLTFFNLFTAFNGQRKTASYHMISGNVYHFHVQYPAKEM